MTRVMKAELLKLTRPRTLLLTAVAVVAAALVAGTVAFTSAESGPPSGRGVTLGELAAAGGGTEAFSLGMSFTGFFVFVVLTANWAGEFSQGTFRTLLMKQPRRLDLIAGKLAALIAFAAGVLLAFEAAAWATSLVLAPMNDVSTSAWFSLDAVTEAAEDYGTAVAVVSAWSIFAMMLAVLVRSIPVALGIGIAWAGPFEHITQEAWDAASGIYPGLLLEALAVGGTPDVAFTRALVLVAGYVAVAAAVGLWSFTRRDIVS